MKYLRALKAWPWYYWLVALLVPGGLLLVALRSRSRAGSPQNVDPDAASTRAKTGLDALIGQATDQASSLRSGLANNPLAAKLLGIDFSLIAGGGTEDVAADKIRADQLRADIASTEHTIAAANIGWQQNHWGGKSYDEFAAFVAGHSANLDSLLRQLAELVS